MDVMATAVRWGTTDNFLCLISLQALSICFESSAVVAHREVRMRQIVHKFKQSQLILYWVCISLGKKKNHQANPTQNNTQILHSLTLCQFKQIKSCFCKILKEKKKKKRSFSFTSMALVKDEQKKLINQKQKKTKQVQRERSYLVPFCFFFFFFSSVSLLHKMQQQLYQDESENLKMFCGALWVTAANRVHLKWVK